MYIIRLVAPNEEPREAASYDLEMSFVPMVGDIIIIDHTGRSELRYRVKGRTLRAAFHADHTQVGEPTVLLDVERLEVAAALSATG